MYMYLHGKFHSSVKTHLASKITHAEHQIGEAQVCLAEANSGRMGTMSGVKSQGNEAREHEVDNQGTKMYNLHKEPEGKVNNEWITKAGTVALLTNVEVLNM